jgi:hypothetical protein
MKKILSIDIDEKNRILEMHKNAIKKSFLIEQNAPTSDVETPQKAKTGLQTNRESRIKQLLSKSPKYGFTEKSTFLGGEQNLDVQLTKVTMTNDNGLDTVYINGRIGEQQELDESPYIGDIVFIYRCKEGEFELYKKPTPNTSYIGAVDDETDNSVEKTKKVSKLRKADVGDRYYNNALSKWLRNNLFLCGTKYQPIAQ